MERMRIAIEGMSCGHCVRSVAGALAALDGVRTEQVAVGGAVVQVDPSTVSPDRLTAAVEASGYTVLGVQPLPEEVP